MSESEKEGTVERSEIDEVINAAGQCLLDRNPEGAMAVIDGYVRSAPNLHARAARCCVLGIVLEQAEVYPIAEHLYRKGIALEPQEGRIAYFLYNNLGFVLNLRGQFDEALRYCRHAITMDPLTHNAHKNLGVAHEGKGDFVEAAKSYITATRACLHDPRAFDLLEKLVAAHRDEVTRAIPDIEERVERFRELTTAAKVPGGLKAIFDRSDPEVNIERSRWARAH